MTRKMLLFEDFESIVKYLKTNTDRVISISEKNGLVQLECSYPSDNERGQNPLVSVSGAGRLWGGK